MIVSRPESHPPSARSQMLRRMPGTHHAQARELARCHDAEVQRRSSAICPASGGAQVSICGERIDGRVAPGVRGRAGEVHAHRRRAGRQRPPFHVEGRAAAEAFRATRTCSAIIREHPQSVEPERRRGGAQRHRPARPGPRRPGHPARRTIRGAPVESDLRRLRGATAPPVDAGSVEDHVVDGTAVPSDGFGNAVWHSSSVREDAARVAAFAACCGQLDARACTRQHRRYSGSSMEIPPSSGPSACSS